MRRVMVKVLNAASTPLHILSMQQVIKFLLQIPLQGHWRCSGPKDRGRRGTS